MNAPAKVFTSRRCFATLLDEARNALVDARDLARTLRDQEMERQLQCILDDFATSASDAFALINPRPVYDDERPVFDPARVHPDDGVQRKGFGL